MIFENIKTGVKSLYPKELDEVFRFLKGCEFITTGTYSLNNGIRVIMQEYNTEREEDCKLEGHEKYVDLQYIAIGEEQIGIAQNGEITTPYSKEKDIAFYDGEAEKLTLHEGNFVVLFPSDLHRPKIGNGEFVKKAVVKIPTGIFGI